MERSGIYAADFWRLLLELARGKIRSGVVSEQRAGTAGRTFATAFTQRSEGDTGSSPAASGGSAHAGLLILPCRRFSGLRAGVDVAEIRAVPLLRERIGPGGRHRLPISPDISPCRRKLLHCSSTPSRPDLGRPCASGGVPCRRSDSDGSRIRKNGCAFGIALLGDGGAIGTPGKIREANSRGAVEIGNEHEWPASGVLHVVSLQGRNVLDIVRAGIVWIE